MDHITQLYQNRAKVLQEEVTRLEALLEAMVAPPRPKGASLGAADAGEQADIAKQEALAAARAQADAAAEIKKTEDAKKAIEENPISGRITQAHDAIVDATYRGLAPIKDNYGKIIGGAVALDFLGHLGKNYSQKAGKNLPITSKVLQAAWESTPMAQAVRLKAERAIEAERIAKATRDANVAKLQHQALNVHGEGLELAGTGARAQRLPYDPAEAVLFPNRPAGAGAPKPNTKAAAFEMVSRVVPPGEQMNPEVVQRILTGNYSYPAMLADPDVLKAGLEGAKDLAMTGKEVADRSVLARGARAFGTPAKVARILPVAGAVLSTPDAIRRAKEGDSVGSIGAIAQNFDPTGTIPWAMHMKDTLEQRAKEASTLQRSAQGGTDAVEDWFARPFMDSSMTGRGSNVRQVVQPGEVSPARANYSDIVVAGSVEAPTKGAPTAIQITPEQAREMANPSGAETPTAARDELQAQKEADRQRRLRELIAQRITPSMKM